MGSKANQNLISCQTLAFAPFSPLFFLKNRIAHKMSPKTTFWPFNSLLSVRPCLTYTHFSFLIFFYLKSLKLPKAMFGSKPIISFKSPFIPLWPFIYHKFT